MYRVRTTRDPEAPGQFSRVPGDQQIDFHPLSTHAFQVIKDKLIDLLAASVTTKSPNFDAKQPRSDESYISSLCGL